MTISLSAAPVAAQKRKRVRPTEAFTACPGCGDKNLIPVGPDVLCSRCDWNSCLWDIQRGGMNNLEAAAREFFGVSKDTKPNEQTITTTKKTEKLGA